VPWYFNPIRELIQDMAISLADEEDISLVLANDPDADRFCAAERTNGKWHIFTGNEMGIILAYHIFTKLSSTPNFKPGPSLSVCL
jgi:phosphoglucomutase